MLSTAVITISDKGSRGERETPGFSEIMRTESMKITPFGCLSHE